MSTFITLLSLITWTLKKSKTKEARVLVNLLSHWPPWQKSAKHYPGNKRRYNMLCDMSLNTRHISHWIEYTIDQICTSRQRQKNLEDNGSNTVSKRRTLKFKRWFKQYGGKNLSVFPQLILFRAFYVFMEQNMMIWQGQLLEL